MKISNYLITGWRHLLKHRLFSVINVLGLAIGIGSCVMISLFVRDELSYDDFWQDGDQIYRLHTTLTTPGNEPSESVVAPGPTKSALERYFPSDIEAITRFVRMSAVVKTDKNAFNETIHLTDPDTVDIFSLSILEGNFSTSLKNINTLAISQSIATKFFGDNEALGKTVTVSIRNMKRDYTISAIFEDLPNNTVLSFQILAKIQESDFPGRFDGWTSFSGPLYIKTKNSESIEFINKNLGLFTDQMAQVSEYVNADTKPSDILQYSTMPIKDLSLYASGWGEMKKTGNREMVVIFSIIALLLLVIACINFMNLTMAKSTLRSKEVALRKTLGAKRTQLIIQFIGETLLLSSFAVLIGLVFVEILLPYYNSFLGRTLIMHYSDPITLASLTAIIIFIGIVGGLYPALIISRHKPATVLSGGKSGRDSSSSKVQNLLVIFQFAVAIILIVSTLIVHRQMAFVSGMDFGYSTDNLLVIKNTNKGEARSRQSTFKNELLKLPEVTHASYSWGVPGLGGNGSVLVSTSTEIGSFNNQLRVLGRDHDFLKTYGAKLVAGRDYNKDIQSDGSPSIEGAKAGDILNGTVIINEKAVYRLGLGSPEEAIGKSIRMIERKTSEGPIYSNLEIIGIAPNLHLRSVQSEIPAEIHALVKGGAPYLTVRYTGSTSDTIEKIKSSWQSIVPNVGFEYELAGASLKSTIDEERSLMALLAVFSSLAVLIASLGLYGLASFVSERRTKEIGIRKVMGARVMDIVTLLVWQFSKPVMIANIIAWPIAIYYMRDWLQGFEYRITDTWIFGLCLVAGTAALLIAWVTVAGHAVRVAGTNPIKALRYE